MTLSILPLVSPLFALVPLAAPPQADPAQSMEDPIALALTSSSPDVQVFNDHVVTLASPWMDGRLPGTPGMEHARDYVQHWLEVSGIEPAFEVDGQPSWRQPFELAPDVQLETQSLTVDGAAVALSADTDFRALSLGAAGTASGTPVFVGYGIEKGPSGNEYRGYPDELDLTGKIAVVLRFEPMKDDGTSAWSTNGPWSARAGFATKLRDVSKRHPAGIVIVNPPECADERSGQLNPFQSGRAIVDVPVVQISREAGERLCAALDPEGRSLLALRKQADIGATIAEWKGRLSLDVRTRSVALQASNIGGVLMGKGRLANELVLIGAHMDHLGMGEFGSRSGPGKLHPGADDNASGTAAILMLADRLKRDYEALPEGAEARSILFLCFDAEESGLNGSQYYVEHPIVPLAEHALMINFDMIGRIINKRLSITGANTGEGLSDLVQPLFETSGLEIVQPERNGGGSDHLPFLQKGVPILFAILADINTHEDYHTPGDVSSKINRVDAVRTIDLFHKVLLATAQSPERWAFQRQERQRSQRDGNPAIAAAPSPEPDAPVSRASLRVRFGIRPGDEGGESDQVVVASVTAGSPAAAAGIQEGDVLYTWNGKDVGGIPNWMALMSQHLPGDEVTVVVLRDGKEVPVKVTLAAPAGNGG